jgi:hypothetical protein
VKDFLTNKELADLVDHLDANTNDKTRNIISSELDIEYDIAIRQLKAKALLLK